MTTDRMRQLASVWTAAYAEVQALWNDGGRDLPPKAWEELSDPFWTRLDEAAQELGPPLLEWAEANDCGVYHVSLGGMVPPGWQTKRGGYAKIRERTGLTAHGRVIRELLTDAGWPRVEKLEAESRAGWAEKVGPMSDAEFDTYIESYCAISPRGQNTKALLLEIRAEMRSGS